jgi:hypothetical protein
MMVEITEGFVVIITLLGENVGATIGGNVGWKGNKGYLVGTVEDLVGADDSSTVGFTDGSVLGIRVGIGVGMGVGRREGITDGTNVGLIVGLRKGVLVLATTGDLDSNGARVNLDSGAMLGTLVGKLDGSIEGLLDGWLDGSVEGLLDGWLDGSVEGLLDG